LYLSDDSLADSGPDNTISNGSADKRCADSGSDNTISDGSADDRCADSGSDSGISSCVRSIAWTSLGLGWLR
jgi:hypothetical protein